MDLKRLGLLSLIWFPIVSFGIGFTLALIAVLTDSALLGNLCGVLLVGAFFGALGCLMTYGLSEVKIPPKEPRLSREDRKRIAAALRTARADKILEESLREIEKRER